MEEEDPTYTHTNDGVGWVTEIQLSRGLEMLARDRYTSGFKTSQFTLRLRTRPTYTDTSASSSEFVDSRSYVIGHRPAALLPGKFNVIPRTAVCS